MLLDIDQYLFHLLNYEWHNAVFDYILPLYRNKYFWIPVYAFIILFTSFNFGKKSYYIILFLILNAGASDFISSKLIKNSFQRLRPCNNVELVEKRTLVKCGSGYSFTSSHATNHFALSFFLIFLLRDKKRWLKWLLFFWAASISYSQVYVGVHYPLDIFFGALLGITIATVTTYFYRKYFADRNMKFA